MNIYHIYYLLACSLIGIYGGFYVCRKVSGGTALKIFLIYLFGVAVGFILPIL